MAEADRVEGAQLRRHGLLRAGRLHGRGGRLVGLGVLLLLLMLLLLLWRRAWHSLDDTD